MSEGVSQQSISEKAEPNTATKTAAKALTSFMLRGRRRYPRAWEPWTAEEERQLTDLYLGSRSLEEISQILGRGMTGITQRLTRLGLLGPKAVVVKQRKPRLLPVPEADFLPSEVKLSPDERWIEETAQVWGVEGRKLAGALQQLDQRHWLVFVLRYGLAGRCSYSLKSVAKLLGQGIGEIMRLQTEAECLLREALTSLECQPIMVTLRETLTRCYGRPLNVARRSSC